MLPGNGKLEGSNVMRKWGIVVTIVYSLIILGILTPAAILIVGDQYSQWGQLARNVWGAYTNWAYWIPVGVVVCGEALLLFLDVDTSWRRAKPRAHILVSGTLATVLTGMLSAAAIFAVQAAAPHKSWLNSWNSGIFVGALWLLWGIFFYFYLRNSLAPVTRVISWLLRGSVLELLIAVPCHIIVRRRHDCSAPPVTSFGIATGMAIMLLSFGPSVLLLYKKRIDEYTQR
jgi:hypothetical protein